jgi:RNA polymerase-interacting CarD/CdnL/TRCF family regulator
LVATTRCQVVQFLIREQKYFELLEKRKLKQALKVLQTELAPLHYGEDKLHKLSRYFPELFIENLTDLKL